MRQIAGVSPSTPQSPITSMPPRLLRVLVDAMAAFPARAREHGKVYAAVGRVGPLEVREGFIEAVVRATTDCEVTWEWEEEQGLWWPGCTCRASPDCEHTYAVACCVVDQAKRDLAFFDKRLVRLLPAAVRRPRAGPERPAPRGADAARNAPPRPASPSPGKQALEELRRAGDFWERQRVLEQMLREGSGAVIRTFAPPFPEILDEADFDLMCWFLAREIGRRTGGWVPAALADHRERPDLVERYRARHFGAMDDDLTEWALRRQRRATPERRLRLVFGFEPAQDGSWAITLEARQTSARLRDEPRTGAQLQQLLGELRRNPEMFPPGEARILEVLSHGDLGGLLSGYSARSIPVPTFALKRLLLELDDPALASWDEELPSDPARRAGIAPGDPVRFRRDPARLLPACVERDSSVHVDLSFYWPDGRQCPFGDGIFFRGRDDGYRRNPSLLLEAGAFSEVIDQPPPELLDRFLHVGSLPIAPERRTRMLALLASSFPNVREALAPHTRLLDVTPVVVLDLFDDWLQLRLFAHDCGPGWRPGAPSTTGSTLSEYSPAGGWVRVAEAPGGVEPAEDLAAIAGATGSVDARSGEEANGDGESARGGPGEPGDTDWWLELPDPRRVDPLVEWLPTTGARPGTIAGRGARTPPPAERDVGWWLRLGPKSTEAFGTAWDRRPAGVQWLGTERVRRMLGGADHVAPRIRIEASGVDWLQVSAEWEAEGLRLTDAELSQLRSSTARFVKLSSGWVGRDVATLRDSAASVLADLGIEPGEGPQRLTMWQLAQAGPQSLEALERMGVDGEARDALEKLRQRIERFAGLPVIKPPRGLRADLRPYQSRGLDFLAYTSGLGLGAVLADDMGLGKTVQALAWLEHLRERDPKGGPSLVVCPTSVMHNWEREAVRFTPRMRVLLLARGSTRHTLRREIPSHDLIVTNYALLRRDLEAWKSVELRAAILDEAQNIKNPDAAVSRAALELNARHRLALTGTPLENRALDLWSIMAFVNPGYLGSRARFSARFDRLDAPPHARALLGARLRPVLLRRMKREVASDLPERIEERRDCSMTAGQRKLYLAELARSRALVERLADSEGGLRRNKIEILAALTRLRQICCHPALAGGKATLGSGKFDALEELLEPLLAEGHKVLLFSQFVRCLDLLAEVLETRGIAHHMLTGQTVKRDQVVRRFESDARACVFLISLKAGGTGLNLTSANYVVLFDPWWNPAVEAQAIDRTHRIGQDRTVIAYRMLTEGTIEEKIWELQQKKATLARDIIGEDGFARALERRDLDVLLAES